MSTNLPLNVPLIGSASEAATWVPIASIKPWDKNPWDHPKEQIQELAASIRAYGWGRTILAQSSTGRIIGGHGIRLAMLSILAEDPEYILPGSPGPGYVPVRFVEVSDQKAAALALMDNRSSRLAKQNDVLLGELLPTLMDEDFPIGYDEDEAMAIIAANSHVEEALVRHIPDEEAFEDLPTPPSADSYEPSSVRMVQLFLDDKTHPQFMADIATIQLAWGEKDLTETVRQAVADIATRVSN